MNAFWRAWFACVLALCGLWTGAVPNAAATGASMSVAEGGCYVRPGAGVNEELLYLLHCAETEPALRHEMFMVLSGDLASRERLVLEFWMPGGGFDRGMRWVERQRSSDMWFVDRVLAGFTADNYPNVSMAAQRAKVGTVLDRRNFVASGFAAALAEDRSRSASVTVKAKLLRDLDREFVQRVADFSPSGFVCDEARVALAGDDRALVTFMDSGLALAAGRDLAWQRGVLRNKLADLGREGARLTRIAEQAELRLKELSGDEAVRQRVIAVEAWQAVGAFAGQQRVFVSGFVSDASKQASLWGDFGAIVASSDSEILRGLLSSCGELAKDWSRGKADAQGVADMLVKLEAQAALKLKAIEEK